MADTEVLKTALNRDTWRTRRIGELCYVWSHAVY